MNTLKSNDLTKELLFSIVFTLLFSGLFLIGSIRNFLLQYDLYICSFLILTLGILHGSFDFYLQLNNNWLITQSKSWRLFFYLGSIALFTILFYYFTALALIAFITISGYHFGEQNFYQTVSKKTLIFWLRLSYGLSVLFLLFYQQFEEVSLFLKAFLNISVSEVLLLLFLAFFGLGQLILQVRLLILNQISLVNLLLTQLGLLILSWFFSISDLLWGFTFYFIFWHSIPSIRTQILNNYKVMRWHNLMNYLKKSFPFWMISVIGIGVLVYVQQLFLIDKWIFSVLVAATIPHIILIKKMLENSGVYTIE